MSTRRLLADRRTRFAAIGLLVLALVGFVSASYATRWGVGLTPDSASYIAGAIGIAQGKGFGYPTGLGPWEPTTSWPPMYPDLLAIPIAVGADPLATARWLNAALLALSILLVGILLWRMDDRHWIVPVLGAALFALNRDTLMTFGFAWSEGALIFLGLLSVFCLDAYLGAGRSLYLILSGLFAAMAVLTRYSGAAFVLLGVVALLVVPDGRRRFRRVRDAAVFLGVSCLPLLFWLLRNVIVAGSITGGGPAPGPVREDEWQGVRQILYLWFMPGRVGEPLRSWLLILVGLALAGIFVYLVRSLREHSPAGQAARVGFLAMTFLLCYAGVLLASRWYLRFFPFDDSRQFLPLYPAVLISVASAWVVHSRTTVQPGSGGGAASRGNRLLVPAATLALSAYTLLLIGAYGSHSLKWLLKSHAEGMGYAGDSWRSSALVSAVRTMEADIPVFSNAYDALFLLTGREVRPLPASGESDPPAADWASLRAAMSEERGLIVVFNLPTRSGMVDEERLTAELPLCPVLEADEGRIYRLC